MNYLHRPQQYPAMVGSERQQHVFTNFVHVLRTSLLSCLLSLQVGGRLPGGLLLRGLSSGERRRLSIAVGILADPSILFLDEPTSGLDSFAALSVMSHLQVLAHRSGKAVIAAIHQPRSAIWNLFDKVCLRQAMVCPRGTITSGRDSGEMPERNPAL
eukprot:GHUV01048084.1.p1 GENE.GHUV01048084.1~~GHUV01048084.1.p1  ORF type:complete len:157 (+),score=26.56 GHUV01048084.1:267-737(+)